MTDEEFKSLPYGAIIVMEHKETKCYYEVLILFSMKRFPDLSAAHHEKFDTHFNYIFLDCRCIEGHSTMDSNEVITAFNKVVADDEYFSVSIANDLIDTPDDMVFFDCHNKDFYLTHFYTDI